MVAKESGEVQAGLPLPAKLWDLSSILNTWGGGGGGVGRKQLTDVVGGGHREHVTAG